jgi:hypothetical protein
MRDSESPNYGLRCQDCQFFDNLDTAPGEGLCRRRMPQPASAADGTPISGWPVTKATVDWCGDLEER